MSKVLDIMFYRWTWPFCFVPSGNGHVFESVEIFFNSYYYRLSEKPNWSTKFMDGKGTIICMNVVKQR